MSYFPKPSLNENDLAIIERADTASRAYSAGQYVSWHGRTGKAKAVILQGATLSESLFDYEADGVINELNNKFPGFIGETITDLPTTDGYEYTAPQNCWMFVRSAGVTGQGIVIRLDGKMVYSYWESGNGTTTSSCCGWFPVKAGQVIKINKEDSGFPRYTTLRLDAMIE